MKGSAACQILTADLWIGQTQDAPRYGTERSEVAKVIQITAFKRSA